MATFRKRQARGKTVYDVQIRRKGFPSLNATFARLTDAKQWAARQEVTISEARAVPGRAARQHTVAELIERYLETGSCPGALRINATDLSQAVCQV